jgi:hypothetical protein
MGKRARENGDVKEEMKEVKEEKSDGARECKEESGDGDDLSGVIEAARERQEKAEVKEGEARKRNEAEEVEGSDGEAREYKRDKKSKKHKRDKKSKKHKRDKKHKHKKKSSKRKRRRRSDSDSDSSSSSECGAWLPTPPVHTDAEHLFLAASLGQLARVEFFLEGDGAFVIVEDGSVQPNPTLGVDTEDAEGWSLLDRAAAGGHADLCEYLLHMRCDPNRATGPERRTALHRACDGAFAECVRVLVAGGASEEAEDAGGVQPLDLGLARLLAVSHTLKAEAEERARRYDEQKGQRDRDRVRREAEKEFNEKMNWEAAGESFEYQRGYQWDDDWLPYGETREIGDPRVRPKAVPEAPPPKPPSKPPPGPGEFGEFGEDWRSPTVCFPLYCPSLNLPMSPPFSQPAHLPTLPFSQPACLLPTLPFSQPACLLPILPFSQPALLLILPFSQSALLPTLSFSQPALLLILPFSQPALLPTLPFSQPALLAPCPSLTAPSLPHTQEKEYAKRGAPVSEFDAYVSAANALTPTGIERDWAVFMAKAAGEAALLFTDVPFPLLPPKGGPRLDASAATLAAAGAWLGIFQFSSGPRDRTQEEQLIKRQVRQAYLRWHPVQTRARTHPPTPPPSLLSFLVLPPPTQAYMLSHRSHAYPHTQDKFQQAFGQALAAGERDRVRTLIIIVQQSGIITQRRVRQHHIPITPYHTLSHLITPLRCSSRLRWWPSTSAVSRIWSAPSSIASVEH